MRYGTESPRPIVLDTCGFYGVVRLLIVGSNPSLTTICYLIPDSRVTTIGEFRISREWWCKIRGTYNGRVPKTK